MSAPDAAVLALHYQNDVLHPAGKIRVGLDADGEVRQRV
ncbi:MAG: cysteine hydrolase, partial [Achromobacter sp.]|nr:cysteine hydrolase [Achromobacter sp.]